MESNHKWSFNDFVTRIQELSDTPKKFCAVVFKTMLREFKFYSNDSNTYGYEILKDIFIPDGTVFMNPFPAGLMQNLLEFSDSSMECEDKTMLKDEEILKIVASMEAERQNPLPCMLTFEEVLQKLKSFCQDELTLAEALERLEFVHDFDALGIEWILRILTCTVPKKLKCTEKEMRAWFNEVINPSSSQEQEHQQRRIGIIQAPMLLVKTSYGKTDYKNKIERVCSDSYFTETKYDGDRFHVHKMGHSYRFYTRNQQDYTEKLGKHSQKEFAARIHPLFKDDVSHCIIDCELIVYDRNTEKCIGKNEKASDGKIYDVKNVLESTDDDHLAVTRTLCVFDIMYINGEDISNWTLLARRRVLESIFQDHLLRDDTLFISPFTVMTNRKDFIDYYNEAMAAKSEGIVVKSFYSTYKYGTRSQENGWYKIKPDYDSGYTLDLVVVAVRFDSKTKNERSFEVAALVSEEPLKFKMVGTVSKNTKVMDCERLLETLKGPSNKLLDNKVPDWVQRKETVDKTVRFVERKNLAVVEVRASAIMRGMLRFPTIKFIRTDKSPSEADTVKSVEDYENRIRKPVNLDDETNVRPSRKRKIQYSVPAQYKRHCADLSNPNALWICNYIIKDTISQSDLEGLTKLGLNFSANLTKDCVCVVTDDPKSFKVRSAINHNKCHIVKSDWLRRCRDEKDVVPWKSDDMVFESTNATFSLLEESHNVEETADNDDDEEERMEVDPLQDLIDNDSDQEIWEEMSQMRVEDDEQDENENIEMEEEEY